MIDEETNPDNVRLEEWYHAYRRYALSIAYRMLGTMADAEDVVQDCFIELQQQWETGTTIKNVKAYLAKMTVNRCLNVLNSARKQRETYVGEWLPEPVPGTGPDNTQYFRREAGGKEYSSSLVQGSGMELPEEALEQKDMISYAFLVMLEQLNPLERAVFVLREIFSYEYKEIGEILGKTESNCRQICSRSRRKLSEGGFHADDNFTLPANEEQHRRHLLERFMKAFLAYDAAALAELLAEQPVFVSDGGGFVHTVLRPMAGRKGVLALLSSPRIFAALRAAECTLLPINNELQLVFRDQDRVAAVLCLALSEDRNCIQNLYLIVNPHKLELTSKNIFGMNTKE